MTQEKHSATSQHLFGFTGQDYILLVGLIVVLLGGLLGANWWIRQRSQAERGGVRVTNPTPAAFAETELPTEIPTEPPNTSAPVPTATQSPTQAAETATPTATLTVEIPPTFTEVAESIVTSTALLPTITVTPVEDIPTPSPIPSLTVTVTPTTPTTTTLTQTTTVPTPHPQPATIAYVQSNGPTHDLGLVTSDGRLINASLHRFAAAPAWSLDGTRIAFFGEEHITDLGSPYQEEGSGIWVVDLFGVQASNPIRLAVDFPIVHIKNLAWSPNADRLACEIHPPGVPAEVRVIDANTGATISQFPGEQPAWRPPDGQQFAARNCPNLAAGLCLINIDGGAARQLTTNGTDNYPVWSPDGQYLAFASRRNEDWDIYRLEFDDNGIAGELKQLTFSQYTEIAPVFSPDGQEIYFITNRYGDWRIVATDLNGENEHTIISGIGESNDWGLARPTTWQPSN